MHFQGVIRDIATPVPHFLVLLLSEPKVCAFVPEMDLFDGGGPLRFLSTPKSVLRRAIRSS